MTPSAEKHLQRHPNARPSKLKQLEKQDETLSKLQREIRDQAHADKAVNDYRDQEGWERGPNALMLIAGKLKVLALKAKELVQ